VALAVIMLSAQSTAAHFLTNSNPRIVHVAQTGDEETVILVRMPAPLALLPDDWAGQDDPRLPLFATRRDGDLVLKPVTLAQHDAAVRALLEKSLTLTLSGEPFVARVAGYRVWARDTRPSFGTLKTALAAFEKPYDRNSATPLALYDLTLDIWMTVASDGLSGELRVKSLLGQKFRVVERLGNVIKLYRAQGVETKATIGVLDVSFPAFQTRQDILLEAALTGAVHIYRGLDHLALILLIAISASGWRSALSMASAFTLGHLITLTAGLYGVAPDATWFVPLIEIGITLSIVFAGVAVCFWKDRAFGWIGLFVIGLVHGYGFASSASEAMFSGEFDPLTLVAFAVGLEFCQFAIYALVIPLILLADRAPGRMRMVWRPAIALSIAASAFVATGARVMETSNTFFMV
jgi:hypothetical protein